MSLAAPALDAEVEIDLPESALLETAAGPVEYASYGAGPAVLCLHGAMGGYDQSLLLAKVLGGAGYRYVALSRPGYLRTPLALGRTPEAQADLCTAVLDALDLDRAAVMAVSGGGPTAIHLALRHPARCWALVLVSTTAQPVDNRLPWSFHVMKVLARLPWVAASMERRAREDPVAMARRTITDREILARTMADPEAWALLRALQLSTVDRMALRTAGTEIDVEATRTRSYPLEDVAVPTLVLQGTADPLLPFERHGRVLAARIPGAELLALEGGEHAAIFSHRGEARARVGRFLRERAPVAPLETGLPMEV